MTRRLLAVLPAAAAGFLVLRLFRAFLTNDFAFEVVAEQGRRGAPWYYRLAGAWATAPGSLLVFTAIVGGVGAVATWRRPRAALVTGATTAVLLGVGLGWASPFRRLPIPAVGGLGLTPILEHWAMAIHPPLLYAALACCLPPFAEVVAGEGWSAASVRRWLGTALVLATVAITLGAFWSYAEQGWGGYWAWDPVENSSFAVWLAVVAVLHTIGPGRTARAPAPRWPGAVPWLVALAGSAASRSGAVPSVHAFAESGRVGVGLAGAALVSAGSVVVVARAGRGRLLADRWARYPSVLAAATLVIVTVGIATPFVMDAFGHDVRVAGEFYARLLLPVAIGGAALILRLGPARPVRRSVWLAHGGFVLLVVAVLGTTADTHGSATIRPGQTVELAGHSVTNEGVTVEPGPRPGTESVVASLVVDGSRLRPTLTGYPERGGVLAETATDRGVVHDVQVVLVRADDAGRALVEVRGRPATNLVWLAAVLIALGSALALGRTRPTAAEGRDEPVSPPVAR